MEDLKLSEAQSRYYGDLFLCCCDKNEASGKVSFDQATELFRSANLHADLVRQILRIAQIGEGATQISRRQFYSCLKLISACQAGFSPAALCQDTLHEDISPMALPRFSWFDANDVNREGHDTSSSNTMNGSVTNSITNGQCPQSFQLGGKTTDLIELSAADQARSGPSTDRCNNSTGVGGHSEQPSTDSEVEQNDDSSAIENSDGRRQYGSPSAWSTGSESPTPTNSVAVARGSKGAANLWHGLLCEEQRQLLGTEEESSDRHSSDDDPNEEAAAVTTTTNNHHVQDDEQQQQQLLYTISEDQRAYYTKQYQAVQRDAAGNVSGPVARVFFEKSRIPVQELRHVWKLCDATRDGALSEAEFMAAMHLVVLRRNHIPLPLKLPSCLHAANILTGSSSSSSSHPAPQPQLQEADLLHLNDDENEVEVAVSGVGDECDGGVGENSMDCGPESINSVTEEGGHHRGSGKMHAGHLPPVAARTMPPPPLPNSGSGSSTVTTTNANESAGDWSVSQASSAAWTKFNESPTTALASNVSSPGPKPVHFDIQWTVQAVGADPQILHPIALRLTPLGVEGGNGSAAGGGGGLAKERETSASPNNKQNAATTTTTSLSATTASSVELRPIQRPQAKKVTAVGALPPPPVRDSQMNMMNMSIDSAAILSGGGGGRGKEEDPQQSSSSPDEDNSSSAGSGGGQQPPIPPPRLPITRHTRSSSLDLNKLLLQSSSASITNVPQSASSLLPEVPPRDPPHLVQAQHSCDSKLESTFADFSQFSEAAKQPTTTTHKPAIIPSKRTSAFEVYRKPIPQQVSPVLLDQEKKVAHLEEMLRSLSLSRVANTTTTNTSVVRVSEAAATVQQLKDQNAVLVNLCVELGNELFAMKYKREEMTQRLQQADVGNRTAAAATGEGPAVAGGGRAGGPIQ